MNSVILFIFKLLEDRKIGIANLKCEFSAVPLNEEQARIFRLQPGQPMMRVDYTHLDKDGAALLLGQTICRADRFVFEVNLPRKTGRGNAERTYKFVLPGLVPGHPLSLLHGQDVDGRTNRPASDEREALYYSPLRNHR